MRATAFLILLLAATTATAETPRKKACDLLSAADVEAVFGLSPLRQSDPANNGTSCKFEKNVNRTVFYFGVFVAYTDAPDADMVNKFLKGMETRSYDTARPAPGIGDAAYYIDPNGNTSSLNKTLVVFVAGTIELSLGPGTPEQLRTLAEKALGGAGRTGFAYNSAVPAIPKPALPPTNAKSASPLDELKAALTKKADAGDVRAEEALAGLYRFADSGGSSAAKPDYPAAKYWYQRASDHGVARASFQLATMYHEGVGGPVNDDAAKVLFTKAADAGYVPAMMPLAFIYAASPDFVSKRRAASWALKAADGNDPEGHLTAGYLWDKGLLSFDEAESGRNALAEYRKAADQGNCIAVMNIGGLYFNGSHGLRQDAGQAEQWFTRAQACFGKGVQDMQQKAARYRSLAAAGHLPVPQAPPPPQTTSRFFNRRTSSGQELTDLTRIAADIVAVAALSAAYLVAHPEIAAQLPAPAVAGSGGSDNGFDRLQNDIHYAQVERQVWSGGCKPPVGCF